LQSFHQRDTDLPIWSLGVRATGENACAIRRLGGQAITATGFEPLHQKGAIRQCFHFQWSSSPFDGHRFNLDEEIPGFTTIRIDDESRDDAFEFRVGIERGIFGIRE
jgi:hypothetical protein